MTKAIGAALLTLSVVLLVWCANSSESLGSEISRIFRGTPTDRTLRLLVGGIAAGAAGLYLLVGPKKKAS